MITADQLDPQKLPRHVAIIMDGNGRWAKSQQRERSYGHQQGVDAVRAVTESAARLGIEYLTLYAFSTENWHRPQEEINALMSILVSAIESETPTMIKNNIRLATIGDIESLYPETKSALKRVVAATSQNTRMTLVLALSYSSRKEMTECVKQIAEKITDGTLQPTDINENLVSQHLYTRAYPDPELLIRTSGEYRLSNYLLWQIAYTELYFTPVLWPDFGEQEFFAALLDYQSRERRFGKTTEQIKAENISE